jgi:hypothetical protein
MIGAARMGKQDAEARRRFSIEQNAGAGEMRLFSRAGIRLA